MSQPQDTELRQKLEAHLRAMPGITIENWKDTDLVCVLYQGRECGHFHGQTILDLRLLPRIIQSEGLGREVSKRIHPTRSAKSRWICVEVKSEEDIARVCELVARASALLA